MFVCAALKAPQLFSDLEFGAVQFGAELAASEIPYFIIERTGEEGHSHYVELGDQSVAAFDGLSRIELAPDYLSVTLHLRFDVPGVGPAVKIVSPNAIDPVSAAWLAEFARELV